MARLIDADTLKAVFEEKSSVAVCGAKLCKAIISRIDESPTVDAEPVRHGHIEADGYTYTCSVCESRLFEHDMFWRYCPYCGARLEDEEECENT